MLIIRYVPRGDARPERRQAEREAAERSERRQSGAVAEREAAGRNRDG
jgi:hypothetical protein